jgi:hypothetical protein
MFPLLFLIHAMKQLFGCSTDNKTRSRNHVLWAMVGIWLVLAIAQVAGAFGLTPTLWGLDQSRYLFPWLPIVMLLGFVVVCLLPKTMQGHYALDNSKETGATGTGKTLLIVVAGMILFWWFRTSTHFLGDGYFWSRHIAQADWLPSFNEPFDALLHRIVYLSGHNWFGWTGADAFVAVSILSGGLYLLAAVWLSDALGRTVLERRFLLLALCSVGTVQLFCGYVESYSLLAALVMLFIAALCSKWPSRHLWAAGITGLATVTHLSGVILWPSLAVYVYLQREKFPQLFKVTLPGIAAAAILPVCVVAGLMLVQGVDIMAVVQEGGPSNPWLSLVVGKTGDVAPYTLFSLTNAWEVTNELLLVAPISLFLLCGLLLRRGKKLVTGHAAIDAIGVLALGYICFLAVFDLKLGNSRDWDIFSPLAIPLTVWGGWYFIRNFRRQLPALVPMVLVYGILQTGGFITINSTESLSLQRVEDLTRNDTWSGYAKGDAYDALRSWSYAKGNLHVAAAYARLSTEMVTNSRYQSNYAAVLAEMKQTLDARHVLEKLVLDNPEHFDAQMNLGALYAEDGELHLAAQCYARALAIDSTIPNLHYNIGVLHIYRNDLMTARQFFNLALRCNPNYAPAAKMLKKLKEKQSNLLSMAQ